MWLFCIFRACYLYCSAILLTVPKEILKKKSMISVCLSVRSHDKFHPYSSISKKLTYITCVTSAWSLSKILWVAKSYGFNNWFWQILNTKVLQLGNFQIFFFIFYGVCVNLWGWEGELWGLFCLGHKYLCMNNMKTTIKYSYTNIIKL